MITIAIPFYNAEKYLAEAINSVLNQSYREYILLLVDDGSTDSSLEIANSFANKDTRIQVFSDGKNRNLGYRLNQIPMLCKTEYLARMDADDIMHPLRIERQIKVLKEDSDIDVLGTNAYTINEKNEVNGLRFKTLEGIIRCDSFIHPTIMAKTQWFLDNKYDVMAVRIEDAELWYRASKISNFKVLLEPLFFYREFGHDYYKKYFATLESGGYLINKYNKDTYWQKFFFKLRLKAFVYKAFSFLNKEQVLISRRNEVQFKSLKDYTNYL
ncbi:glycosyltransferase family 2 protein [Myroides odoratimimus]|uniref:glycosyltransferase family 2 protein n=1 Tax=Myroides odoratimimus TaxID=76832 RepID=UPI001CE15AC9|nr:glycosyltransferase family 2 protein [Myroides odoratimimus]MCA4806983.1 glycosyltransferase family 2 protein [Myroides odoratimimus]